MKVSDVMQKKIDSVTVNTKVKEVARLIFGSRINGVPVLKDRKVVGFITERDILSQFYPSMEEYMIDPVHNGDFEGMEKNVNEILKLPAEKIMSKKPTTVRQNTALLKAYSLMTTDKIGRLPVVDDKGKLIGIISKGDIFNYLVGSNIPLGAQEEFYDWITKHYDIYMDWKVRLAAEIPDLVSLFKKEKVQTVLDVASGTGEHVIALAKEGFQVFGVEASGLMHSLSEEKKSKLSQALREHIHFLKGMNKSVRGLPPNLDAAFFLGNALPHALYTENNILSFVAKILNPKKALMVFQIANFDLKLNKQYGFKEFVTRKSNESEETFAYLGYYSKHTGNNLQANFAIFDSMGGKWMFHGFNSTPIKNVSLSDLKQTLKSLGFPKVEAFGGEINGPLFDEKFDPKKHEWITIVARK